MLSRRTLLIISGIVLLIILVISTAVFLLNSNKSKKTSPTEYKKIDLSPAFITPDSPFYFLSSWQENFRIKTTKDDHSNTLLYLDLAQNRIREVAGLARGNQKFISPTMTRYADQMNTSVKFSVNDLDIRPTLVGQIAQDISTLVANYDRLNNNDAKVDFVRAVDRETARIRVMISGLKPGDRLNVQKSVLDDAIQASRFLRKVSTDSALPVAITTILQDRYAAEDRVLLQGVLPKPSATPSASLKSSPKPKAK